MKVIKFLIWLVLSLIILTIGIFLSSVLFCAFTGIQIVKIFMSLTRALGVHVLKTSIDQRSNNAQVTAEFIATQDEYYALRTAANTAGLWFLNPVWSALVSNKWLYSILIVNKR